MNCPHHVKRRRYLSRFLKVAMLCSFSSLGIKQSEALHYKVILLGGQSNSVGQAQGLSFPTTPVNLQNPQNDVLFYYYNYFQNSALTTLQPGSGGTVGIPSATASTTLTEDPFHAGLELSFGRAIADADSSTNYAVIKHGENGTSLLFNWNAASNGPSYAAFQTTVTDGLAALQAAGHTTEIAGMLWMQGETDAFSVPGYTAYQANLNAFIADVRTRYGANLPFVIGEITRSFTLGGVDQSVGLNAVADAQIAVAAADPNAQFAPGADLVFYDGIHFDGPSLVTLGERMASAFLDLSGDPNVISSKNELAFASDVSSSDLLQGIVPVASGWNQGLEGLVPGLETAGMTRPADCRGDRS